MNAVAMPLPCDLESSKAICAIWHSRCDIIAPRWFELTRVTFVAACNTCANAWSLSQHNMGLPFLMHSTMPIEHDRCATILAFRCNRHTWNISCHYAYASSSSVCVAAFRTIRDMIFRIAVTTCRHRCHLNATILYRALCSRILYSFRTAHIVCLHLRILYEEATEQPNRILSYNSTIYSNVLRANLHGPRSEYEKMNNNMLAMCVCVCVDVLSTYIRRASLSFNNCYLFIFFFFSFRFSVNLLWVTMRCVYAIYIYRL